MPTTTVAIVAGMKNVARKNDQPVIRTWIR